MAADLIPGEALPNYQRWEPTDFKNVARQQVKLPTAEDIERIQHEAHREGYEAGKLEGYEAGLLKAEPDVARIRALGVVLDDALQSLERDLSNELISLALDIAKQMLTRALEVKPELLLPVVRAAIESLPHNTQHPHIRLHPQDAALVREMFTSESHTGWRVIEDPNVSPGGCLIETATAEVDATLSSRWQRIAGALGQDNAWLVDGEEP
jgi:flagellar assembly protein FliH